MLKTELPGNEPQKNEPPESCPQKSGAPFGAAPNGGRPIGAAQAREARETGSAEDARGAGDARGSGDARDSRGAALLDEPDGKKLDIIRQYVAEVKFGSVTILIQDGKVVQIEKTEKKRFR
ncbi:MAG: YezD family protein [Clostridiales bacterium]|jgi:hypothetical protein|nr:YezD family protein [Clostridiales bacterium]